VIAVDTNVLIYAHREECARHAAALAELRELAEDSAPWGLPVFCLAEFIRVVTHRRVFDPPSELPAALGFLAALLTSPSARLLLPIEGYAGDFLEACRAADARGNLAFDAQIAALCRQHGVSMLLTADRDFARFDGLKPRYL
jgi:hypothetical protein